MASIDVIGVGSSDSDDELELAPPVERSVRDQCKEILESLYQQAESAYEAGNVSGFVASLGPDLAATVRKLGQRRHGARGALLTLALYKVYDPDQDIRCNKVEHPNGFSGRNIDSAVTVPFLNQKTLQTNVETNWLTQILSFHDVCWTRSISLTTNPLWIGEALIDVVNTLEESPQNLQPTMAEAIAVLLLHELIDVRNRGKVLLTKPKGLVIDQVLHLLGQHFRHKYKKNAPRLPQIAVYAMYECLIDSVGRYKDFELEPLGRLKAADRKARTVGDIVLKKDGYPIEAVETKFDIPIGMLIVGEAIAKIRTASVERYFILSTANIDESERDDVARLCRAFRSSNGCEIIPNGLLETIWYYLRLLPSTNEFVIKYTERVETDIDLDYEHRIAWNEICAALGGP